MRHNPECTDPAAIARSLHDLTEAVTVIDRHVATRAFVAGATFTVADIAIGLSLHRWYSIPAERPELPAVRDYHARLCERPGFARHGRDGGPEGARRNLRAPRAAEAASTTARDGDFRESGRVGSPSAGELAGGARQVDVGDEHADLAVRQVGDERAVGGDDRDGGRLVGERVVARGDEHGVLESAARDGVPMVGAARGLPAGRPRPRRRAALVEGEEHNLRALVSSAPSGRVAA